MESALPPSLTPASVSRRPPSHAGLRLMPAAWCVSPSVLGLSDNQMRTALALWGCWKSPANPTTLSAPLRGETRLPQSPQRAPAPLPAERKFSVCGTRFLRPVYQSQSTALRSSSAPRVPQALPGGSFFFSPEPDLQGAHPCPRSRPGSHRVWPTGSPGKIRGREETLGYLFFWCPPCKVTSDHHL